MPFSQGIFIHGKRALLVLFFKASPNKCRRFYCSCIATMGISSIPGNAITGPQHLMMMTHGLQLLLLHLPQKLNHWHQVEVVEELNLVPQNWVHNDPYVMNAWADKLDAKEAELEKQGLDEIKFMIDVNLIGSFNMIKAVLPGMKARKDRSPASISLMSSQAGQVGIYGYTAYSASKFGLRGLAEALQHEVIADNIHVSLVFPPDTDTPGFAEENKMRPQLTSIIAGSTGAMKEEEIAKKALDDIKSGGFFVNCNFEGTLIEHCNGRFIPAEVILNGIC